MSFSLLARKLVCGIAAMVPVIVSAQSGFAPLGGEYAIVGALPADQSHPRLSINAGGGYVVWQDQNTFGNRQTIMARPLNSSLGSSLPPFRVNANVIGDQQNPRVALLNNGGAVFVWQGGQFGFQHIFARFLSASNTWIALDQLVNSSTRTYQSHPGVAVLTNGNVVIVYATFNTNTMQDVYGQMYSPAGVKIGGEFQLNHYTAFNQRAPAITALPGGGFAAAWVSEQQNAGEGGSSANISGQQVARPSVDIYARLYNADGTPANNEFGPVNAGSYISAEPTLAAGADGTVMAAWSSFDGQIPNNGWDIMARPITFSGSISLLGTQARVNTQLYGDQHSPQISALGTNYLAVWTSLKQDGSREGIYGQFLNGDGSYIPGDVRVNTTTFGIQQQPAVASDNVGRFLAVWTGPTFGPSRNDLFAQTYANASYVASTVADNYGSPVFIGQSNAPVVTGNPTGIHNPALEPPTLDYPGTIAVIGSGIPATNAFTTAAGSYNGLFYDLNGVSSASAGYFSATITAQRNYSAKLVFSGASYSLSGKLNDFGNDSRIIARAGGLAPLVVILQVDLFGADQISGTIKSGNDWNASIYANRQSFNSTTALSPFTGAYTLTLPGFAGGPGGTGFGTILNSKAGVVAFNGTLADGKKITQTSAVSKSGIWPLFATLPGGEMVMSWIAFSGATPGGNVAWIKPANKMNALYPAGFTNEVTATVAANSPVVAGMRSLSLSGAGVSQGYVISMDANGKASTNGVVVTVAPATGAFTGKVPNPVPGRPAIPINGVLQNGGVGRGHFLGTNASGNVILQLP